MQSQASDMPQLEELTLPNGVVNTIAPVHSFDMLADLTELE
jgi:hypothetical protein